MLLRNLATVGALAAFVLTGTAVLSPSGGANVDGQAAKDPSDQPIYRKFQDLKWEKIIPELGDGSPTMTILHVDPTTQATQLMISNSQEFPCAEALAHGQRDTYDRERHNHLRTRGRAAGGTGSRFLHVHAEQADLSGMDAARRGIAPVHNGGRAMGCQLGGRPTARALKAEITLAWQQ